VYLFQFSGAQNKIGTTKAKAAHLCAAFTTCAINQISLATTCHPKFTKASHPTKTKPAGFPAGFDY
jgi:hypothetical protein